MADLDFPENQIIKHDASHLFVLSILFDVIALCFGKAEKQRFQEHGLWAGPTPSVSLRK